MCKKLPQVLPKDSLWALCLSFFPRYFLFYAIAQNDEDDEEFEDVLFEAIEPAVSTVLKIDSWLGL